MGTLRGPRQLSGFLIPYRATNDGGLPGGGDYTVLDPQPGRFVAGGTSLLRVTPSLPPGVDIETGLTSVDVQTVAPGAPGPDAGAIAYRRNGSGLWYGADEPIVFTGYTFIGSVESADVSTVTLRDGRVVLCWTSSTNVFVQIRAADGTWGSAISVLTTTTQSACIMQAPDGALHVYAAQTPPGESNLAIGCWRSVDGGTTWTRQSYNVGIGGGSISTGDLLRAASVGGTVALFRSDQSVPSVLQFVSSDGGFRFTTVGATHADATIWSITIANNILHVLTTETDGATKTYYRQFSALASSLWNTTAVEVSATASHTRSSAIAATPEGALYALIDSGVPASPYDYFRSIDGGTTWAALADPWLQPTATDYVEKFTLAWVRGTMLLIGSTTGDGSGSSSDLVEMRLGGHSQCTFSSDVGAPQLSYAPLQSTAVAGYTETDGGTVTRTFSPTLGQRVECALGATASTRSVNVVSSSPSINLFRVRAIFGTQAILCETRGSGTGVTLRIDISPTTIDAYDAAGSPGTPVAHGSAGYVDIIAIVEPLAARAFAAFRIADDTFERNWTELPAVTGMGALGTNIAHEFVQGAADILYIFSAQTSTAPGTTLGNGWTRPAELVGLPLSTTPRFLTGGIDVASAGGIASVDGVTHTSSVTSAYRAENLIPQVAPSPSTVWRSGQIALDETITLEVDHDDRPQGVIGVWLDNMIGVSSIDLTFGLATTTIDLSTDFRYTAIGGGTAVIPSVTGSTTSARWVKPNELAGWRFEDSSGDVHEITGNSAGALTYGSTVAEHRAVIYLATTTTGTNQTGTLYPSRALLLGYTDADDDVTTVEIEIPAADNYDPTEGYRQIGTVAAGRVFLFGAEPDLNDTLAMDSAAELRTVESGQRYSARAHKDRRRAEIAFANSIHEAREMFGATTSPSFAVAYTAGPKAADATGIPLLVEGIVRRAAVESDGLVVWCPAIPIRNAAGWTAQTFGLDATIYGRIVSAFRREGVQMIGLVQDNQVFRVPTIVIEEEL